MRKTRRHIRNRNRFLKVFPILTIVGIGIVAMVFSFYEKSWTYNWDGIRQQIRDSIKVAKNGDIIGRSFIQCTDGRAQFIRISWIMQNATESELLKLTDYPNGTIKTIAYEGLIKKSDFKNKSDIILKAIKDTEYKTYFTSDCLGNELEIGEYLVDFVLQIGDMSYILPPNGNIIKYGLSESECNRIVAEYRKVPSLYR